MNKRTVDQKPMPGELLKPVELIDIVGAGRLSLHASKIYNRLLAHAFGPTLADKSHIFTIRLAELRGLHRGNERISDSLRALQQTLIVASLPDGKTRTVQLLGGTDMDDEDRPEGVLRYGFDHRLVELLAVSVVFGKVELRVIWAFTSKYALALYEAISRRIRLRNQWHEDFDIPALRELLRVEPDKLTKFKNFKAWALEPALREVNGLADFTVDIRTNTVGKRVVGVTLAWAWKDDRSRKAAWIEVERSRIGRRARLLGEIDDGDAVASGQ